MVTKDNVFKVCDVPNVECLKAIIDSMTKGNINEALKNVQLIWNEGYMA